MISRYFLTKLILTMLLAFVCAQYGWGVATACWLTAAGCAMTHLGILWYCKTVKAWGPSAILNTLAQVLGCLCIFLEV